MLFGHWIKTIARFANAFPLFFTMDNYRQTPNYKHRHFVVVVALVVGDVVVVVEIVIVVVVGIAVVIVNVDLDIDIENFCPLRSFHRCILLYLNDTRICPARAQSAGA